MIKLFVTGALCNSEKLNYQNLFQTPCKKMEDLIFSPMQGTVIYQSELRSRFDAACCTER